MINSERFKRITYFFIFFIAVFLPLATFTLSLIIRSFIIFMRNSEWLANYEEWVILGLFSICFIYSIIFAKWLATWFLSSKNQGDKRFFIDIMVVVLVLTLAYWFIPRSTIENDYVSSINNHFIGGPYPNKKAMAALKTKGYTAVVTLLDPLGLPAEPWLLLKERYNAKKLGMPLIHIPMLRDNLKRSEVTIQMVVNLTKNLKPTDKYYVHAYYGRDRVESFIEIVNKQV